MYPYNIENESYEAQREKREEQGARSERHKDVYDKKVAEMVFHSHKYESANLKYYKKLTDLAKNQRDKKVIKEIALDCAKHCQILSDMCAGIEEGKSQEYFADKPITENYMGELASCIFKLMEDVEFYRHLMFAEASIKDKMHEVIIDKQLHINKLIFLHSKNFVS